MQCAHNNQEDFTWVVMWAKRVKEKKWTKEFGAQWSYLAK